MIFFKFAQKFHINIQNIRALIELFCFKSIITSKIIENFAKIFDTFCVEVIIYHNSYRRVYIKIDYRLANCADNQSKPS